MKDVHSNFTFIIAKKNQNTHQYQKKMNFKTVV